MASAQACSGNRTAEFVYQGHGALEGTFGGNGVAQLGLGWVAWMSQPGLYLEPFK